MAPLVPSALLPSTVTLAMFLSPAASAALATDSVEMLSFNCFTFTASVSSLPAATFTILLLPLSKPLAVKVTADLPAAGVMVMPSLLTLVLPIVNEPALVKSTVLFKAKVNTPSVRLTLKFLPALRVNLSPADIA